MEHFLFMIPLFYSGMTCLMFQISHNFSFLFLLEVKFQLEIYSKRSSRNSPNKSTAVFIFYEQRQADQNVFPKPQNVKAWHFWGYFFGTLNTGQDMEPHFVSIILLELSESSSSNTLRHSFVVSR